MRVFLTPQFNENEYITYMFSEERIKAERYVLDEVSDMGSEHQESDKEYKLSETLYYDLSSIETESAYIGDDVVSNAKRDKDGILHVELLNPIKEDSPEEFRFPEWQNVEFEDFEIPEDAEIIQLEEMVFPEPESVVDQEAELAKANAKIAELEKYVNDSKSENEALVLAAIEMMTEMMMMG